jgi:hypothetical protein
MGVSVGRLPQEALLEEFYRSECSETVRVGRVRVFEELLAVFNCRVLTFVTFHREYRTRVRCNKMRNYELHMKDPAPRSELVI